MKAICIALNFLIAILRKNETNEINFNSISSKTQYVQILSFQHVVPAMIQVLNIHMWLVANVLDSTDINHVSFPMIGLFFLSQP